MTDETELQQFEAQLEERARLRDAQIDALQAARSSRPRAEVMDLEAMLERYAYLLHEGKIVDLQRPWLTFARQIFKDITASSTRTIVGPRGGERQVPIADDWLQHPARVDLQAVTFLPNAQRLAQDLAGLPAVNMWSPPTLAARPLPADWEERARVFELHLEYLVPNAVERDNVRRWLAHRIQRPEQLPGWHVVMVAEGAHGTGRNWIARMMKSMLAKYVVEALPLKRILDGHFNGELDTAIVGVVDEIREGGNDYWKHAEALKSFLSEKTRVINKKYRAPYEMQNFLGVMMFSNHIDALPIDKADRRIYVARCTQEPRDKSYFDFIYKQLEDPATLRALYEQLLRVDLQGFDIEGRAPMSEVKQQMIEESRSDEEGELLRIQREWPSDVMRSATLRKMLQAFRDNDLLFGEDRHKSDQLSTGQLRRIYRVCGVKSGEQIRMAHRDASGARVETKFRVVVLRNYEKRWKGANETELRAEVERGEAIDELRQKKEEGSHAQDGH
jgi:hypothetical protein